MSYGVVFGGHKKTEECCFDFGENNCFALTKKECAGCKFRKTKQEFLEGIRDYPLRSDASRVLMDFVQYTSGEQRVRKSMKAWV